MPSSRPININPLSIRLPITAWVSILHRLSGLFVFLLIPLILWGLQISLSHQRGWNKLVAFLGSGEVKFVLWLLLAALGYHLIAGIRHLLMDVHIGDSRQAGHRGAWLVLALSIVLAGAMAARLWGWV